MMKKMFGLTAITLLALSVAGSEAFAQQNNTGLSPKQKAEACAEAKDAVSKLCGTTTVYHHTKKKVVVQKALEVTPVTQTVQAPPPPPPPAEDHTAEFLKLQAQQMALLATMAAHTDQVNADTAALREKNLDAELDIKQQAETLAEDEENRRLKIMDYDAHTQRLGVKLNFVVGIVGDITSPLGSWLGRTRINFSQVGGTQNLSNTNSNVAQGGQGGLGGAGGAGGQGGAGGSASAVALGGAGGQGGIANSSSAASSLSVSDASAFQSQSQVQLQSQQQNQQQQQKPGKNKKKKCDKPGG